MLISHLWICVKGQDETSQAGEEAAREVSGLQTGMGNVLGAARCVGELRGGHKRTRNNEWKPPPVSCVFSKWAVLFGHGSPGKPRSTFLNCLCCKAELLLLFSRLYVKAGAYDGKYGGKQPLSAKADTSARSLLFPASSFFFFF